MVIYVLNVFDILEGRDGYRPEFHVNVPIVEYFGNKMNTNDRMYRARDKKRKKKHKENYSSRNPMEQKCLILTRCTKHNATNSVVDIQFSKSFRNTSL